MDRPARAVTAAVILALALGSAGAGNAQSKPAFTIGVELPLAADDGWRGLAARDGVRLAVDRWNANANAPYEARFVLRDSAQHIGNPHEDEGTDDVDQGTRGAAIVRAFARDPAILAVVGGIRPDVAAAEALVADREQIALLSPTSISVTPLGGASSAFFRTIASDESEGAFARRLAAERGYRHVTVSGRPSRRTRAVERGFGPAAPLGIADAELFVGPETRGSILAPMAAARVLAAGDLLADLERRGYEPKAAPVPYDAFVQTLNVAASERAALDDESLAAYGDPVLDDSISFDVTTTVALEAIASAAKHGPPTRAAVIAALRRGEFSTIAGRVRFSDAGAPSVTCFALTRVERESGPAHVRCIERAAARAPGHTSPQTG